MDAYPLILHNNSNSFDAAFIVSDDLYSSIPNAETTNKLGDAIDKWNYQERTMINNFEFQLNIFNNLTKSHSVRFKEKTRMDASKIIQRLAKKIIMRRS